MHKFEEDILRPFKTDWKRKQKEEKRKKEVTNNEDKSIEKMLQSVLT